MMDEGVDPPLSFDEFKNEIDTRGGYLQRLADSVNCFEQEITQAVQRRQTEGLMILKHLNQQSESEKDKDQDHLLQFVNQILLPDKTETEMNETLNYPEDQRSKTAKLQDERLPLIKEWLTNRLVRNPVLDKREFRKLVRTSNPFLCNRRGSIIQERDS